MKMSSTKTWQIENTVTGVILGIYTAETEAEALEIMARDAGYRDYREVQIVAPAFAGEIAVCEAGPARVSSGVPA